MYILLFKIIGLINGLGLENFRFRVLFFLYILVKYVQVNFYLINKNLVERLNDQKKNLIYIYV